jgi:hypothetical protein
MDAAIVRSADGMPHIFALGGATPVEATPTGLLAAERIVFSPSGSAAALYTDGSVQVVRGLPGAGTLAFEVRLQLRQKSRAATASESLAISDDGAYLLYATGNEVELIGLAGDSRKLMDAKPGALAAFAPASHDAAVIHSGSLTLFRDVIGTATRRDLPGTIAPSAMSFSSDGRTVFIASQRSRTVDAIRLETGESTSMLCDCAPTSLTPMGSLFRLNEMSGSPLWLLDAGTTPRLLFVPAKTDL